MASSGTFAIIRTGGKQYRVTPGDRIRVERLAPEEGSSLEPGSEIVFDRVLALREKDDSEFVAGTPLVDGASVSAKVIGEVKGEKLIAFKKRRRKGHTKKIGHRQTYTECLINSIQV